MFGPICWVRQYFPNPVFYSTDMKGLITTKFNYASFPLLFVPGEDALQVLRILSFMQDSKVPFLP